MKRNYSHHLNGVTTRPRFRQTGLTLIETMVGIAISAILLAGILTIVQANKRTYRLQEAMSRVQESGRFAMQFISRDVRMVGFLGCTGLDGGVDFTNNVAPAGTGSNGYGPNVDTVIQGFDGTGTLTAYSYSTGTLPIELSDLGLTAGSGEGALWPNTDIILVKHATSCPGGNITTTAPASAQFTITNNAQCQIQQNDIVIISNCRTADIIGISNVPGTGADVTLTHGANWNATPILTNGYGPDSFMYRMEAVIYYIGVGESGQPALFKRELQAGTFSNREMVEGIENMAILYGEDRDDDNAADIYTVAGNVLDMDNVVSMRINLQVRTLVDNLTNTQNNGDFRVRQSFISTIVIRNRMS